MNSTTRVRHHLADLLESDACTSFTHQEISKIREGTMPQNKLKSIVKTMRSEGCGVAHGVTTDPSKSSRLRTLSAKLYGVYKVDATHDNIFFAFLHGVSFITNHHPASATVLRRSTKILRTKVVETVLKNDSLQNAMARDVSLTYQRQFQVRYGSEGKRAFSEYSRKMRSNAFGSYTELAALSKLSGIEIHIYDKTPSGFAFIVRYTPSASSLHKKRYVIRLVRGARSHFDVLLPNAYHAQHGFWDKVNKNILGKLGGNAANSPQKALATLQESKNNKINGNMNTLPNENKNKNNNFSWNSSPKLTGGAAFSSPPPSSSS